MHFLLDKFLRGCIMVITPKGSLYPPLKGTLIIPRGIPPLRVSLGYRQE